MSDAERKKDDKKDRDDDKDRERSSSRKDKDRDRKRRSRSRSRSKSRDRKDRSRSRRSRSRSRSPRRKRSRSRSRDKSPPASWRSRNRSPPPPRREGGSDRENPYAETRGDYRAYRYKAREAREAAPLDAMSAKEREKAEYERDQRTVFVYHLSTKTDEKQLIDFFAIAGKVNDVRLIADRRTRKHKGFGYIEFENKESVPKALMMSGQMLNSMSVMVKASEAEKNLLAQSTTTTAAQMASLGPAKVFVGNLHFNLGEDDIRAVFSPFGDIDMIQVAMDDQNQSKGYAFVHFRRMEDGKKAVNGLNGFELAGRAMKVNLETEASRLASSGGGGGGYGGSGANVSNLELDDDEGGGHSLNPQSRAALMQKLARGVMPSPPPAAPAPVAASLVAALGIPVPGLTVPAAPSGPMLGPTLPPSAPSPCILLKNMFDPSQESEPNWEVEIGEDVKEECSKHGPVLHHHVDKYSQGFVYLKFADVGSAARAVNALNGRWFAGKQIAADYIQPATYLSKFGV